MKVVLASASPRRHQLLKELFAEFEVQTTVTDENFIGNTPEQTVMEIASRKICGVTGDLVIGCDTVVYLNGVYYNKPKNRLDAVEMLSALSGKTHQVYSGLAVGFSGCVHTDFECSEVAFKLLERSKLEEYVDTYAPYDKAGAYGIQDKFLVQGYKGSYTNIMGLPVEKLRGLLIKIGAVNG